MEQKILALGLQPLSDVLLIMLDTGMRPAEVFHMRLEHVQWERGVIFVPQSKSRKSKRFVGITGRVREALLARVNPQVILLPAGGHKITAQMKIRARPRASYSPQSAPGQVTSKLYRSNSITPRLYLAFPNQLYCTARVTAFPLTRCRAQETRLR